MQAYINAEAEVSVLGAAMQDPKALQLVVEMEPDEFSYPENRIILMALKEMSKAHMPVDLVTLHAELTKADRITAVGGPAYLARMISAVPTTANVRSYIQIVRECAARRRLKTIGEALINASADPEKTVDSIREKAALTIRDVKASESVRVITQSEAIIKTYEKMDEAQKREGQPEKLRIFTGIKTLDKMTGGLTGSKMVVIGARPSVGKSVFAMTICMNAAKAGKRVLYISLEMEEDEIMEREFAAVAMVPLTEITSDEISPDTWQKLAESMGILSQQPIFYCTEADTVEKVRKAAFNIYENGGLDLICVDYLQLMESGKNRHNRQEEVADISRGLKKLAQELKIPIIALTQLNRSSQKEKRAPTMSEARESGSIEQDANIFILLHDPDIGELKTDDLRRLSKNLGDRGMKLIHVNVDKNRQGKKGIFYVAFDGDHMRFLSLTKEEEQ